MSKVLIVDDDPSVRSLLLRLLRLEGLRPLAAPDGDTALELAQRERPTTAILDYDLDGSTGLEVFRRLREVEPGIRAVMLTGRDDPALRRQALESGLADFLTKPPDLDAILRHARSGSAGGDREPEDAAHARFAADSDPA